MPLTLGTLTDSSSVSSYGYLGSDYSTTSGTSFTFSGKNLGPAGDVLILLVTFPNYVATPITAVAGGFTMAGVVIGSTTSNTRTLFFRGRPTVTTGDITITAPATVTDCVISWYRVVSTGGSNRDSGGFESSSSIQQEIQLLDISSLSGGSHVFSVSNHISTNTPTMYTLDISTVDVRSIFSVAGRGHNIFYGRATNTRLNGIVRYTYSSSARGSAIAVVLNP